MVTRVLVRPPTAALLYARAALPAIPGLGRVPVVGGLVGGGRDETVVLSRERGAGDGETGRATASRPDVPDEAPIGPVQWRLPANLGRRYAAVSGDSNPIHLYDVTARAFGFRKHIAHGMWTKARCLAELGNRLPDTYAVGSRWRSRSRYTCPVPPASAPATSTRRSTSA